MTQSVPPLDEKAVGDLNPQDAAVSNFQQNAENSISAIASSTPADIAADTLETDVNKIRRMIAPLSKEQLIEILSAAAISHTEVYDTCVSTVKVSPSTRRLMIRNIAFSTKNEDFVQFFTQFGEIDDAVIVRDRENKSKGYGFVTFRTSEGVEQCFKADELILDGRQLLAKLAGDPYADFSVGFSGARKVEGSRRKLFIRNLSDTTTSQTLRSIFEHYGTLDECVVVSSPEGRSRGYGFVTFQSADSAIKAVQQPQRVIDCKVAFVAFATPSRARQSAGVGAAASGGERRRSGRDSSQQLQGVSLDSPVNAAAISAGLFNPYTPGYPTMMPMYVPGGQPNYGGQAVGLPVGGYDYMAAATANPQMRRYG